MRKTLAALALLLGLAPAAAQQPNFTALPPNTVVGRLGISSGPAQAIPFATLTQNLLAVACPNFGFIYSNAGNANCTTTTNSGIQQNGPLAIGPVSPLATIGVFLVPTVTTGTDSAALQISPTYTPASSSSLYGIASAPLIANNGGGAITITNFYNMRLEALLKGTGPITVTHAFGLVLDAQTVGSVTNRSMFSRGVVEINLQDTTATLFLTAPNNVENDAPLRAVSTDGNNTFLQLDAYQNGAFKFPGVYMRVARGTQTSPTAIGSGDFIFLLSGEGRDNSGNWTSASGGFVLIADETFTSTAHGTKGCINATKKGTTNNNSILCVDGYAHFGPTSSGVAPGAVSACGTSPSAASGTDASGTLTTGTGGPTACTVAFGGTYAAAPKCTAGLSSGTGVGVSTVSTSSVTFTFGAAASSNTLTWHCLGT